MEQKSKKPIGIFDSGVGGLSILHPLAQALPNENFIYLADTAHVPYGLKSKNSIIKYSHQISNYLINLECKLILVACNTATTNAIFHLRNQFNIPFIGIEPAIKPAALKSKTGVIGVLATQGTISSKLFENTNLFYTSKIKVITQNGEGLVELVEEQKANSNTTSSLLKSYINPMLKQNIDKLVLGCTHYNYLIPTLKKIVSPSVTIVDNREALIKQTKKILTEKKLLNSSSRKQRFVFLTTHKTAHLSTFIDSHYQFEKICLST